MNPPELFYTKDHEWAHPSADQSIVTVGITDHAQNSLGEIVYVELPKTGRELKQYDTFGVVESIKAVSDLYSPVTGTVVEVNESLQSNPGTINRAAYSDGWLIRIKITDKSSLSNLLDASQYNSLVESLK